jgi:hypothetical protein
LIELTRTQAKKKKKKPAESDASEQVKPTETPKSHTLVSPNPQRKEYLVEQCEGLSSHLLSDDEKVVDRNSPAARYIFSFVSSLFVSFFFQFIGFFLTYLMHTTHAAKFGSRAGLGLTLIRYGFYSRSVTDDMLSLSEGNGVTDDPSQLSSSAPMPQDDKVVLNMSSRQWLSFLLMTLGMLRIIYLASFPCNYLTIQVGSCYSPLPSVSGV